MDIAPNTLWVTARAKALGFGLCGVVRPETFPELARTQQWLDRGYAGEMKYLADPRRSNPRTVMPGICSVIVCALNYNTRHAKSVEVSQELDAEEPRGWISRYAWGADYHQVLRTMLDELVLALRERFTEPFEARTYTDTGPLHERLFAKYAGLGWLGKNTLLLNQHLGSLFFLGIILTTLDLDPTLSETQSPPPDLCGTCTQCLDACPTDAFVAPYVMDAQRCISYLTIELRGSIPENLREPMGRHVFGCDICQDVCPWNRRAPVTDHPAFHPRALPTNNETARIDSAQEESLFLPKLEWFASMDESQFREAFRGSPLKRTKWRGLVRNACIGLGNSRLAPGSPEYHRITALLNRLAASPDAVISKSALWALSRIQEGGEIDHDSPQQSACETGLWRAFAKAV